MVTPPMHDEPGVPPTGDPGDPMRNLEPWSEDRARDLAAEEGIDLTEEHLKLVRGLRELYHNNEHFTAREALECMEDRTPGEDSKRHLYQLFPNGPVRQACHIAGLPIPHGASDPSFGNVM